MRCRGKSENPSTNTSGLESKGAMEKQKLLFAPKGQVSLNDAAIQLPLVLLKNLICHSFIECRTKQVFDSENNGNHDERKIMPSTRRLSPELDLIFFRRLGWLNGQFDVKKSTTIPMV